MMHRFFREVRISWLPWRIFTTAGIDKFSLDKLRTPANVLDFIQAVARNNDINMSFELMDKLQKSLKRVRVFGVCQIKDPYGKSHRRFLFGKIFWKGILGSTILGNKLLLLLEEGGNPITEGGEGLIAFYMRDIKG